MSGSGFAVSWKAEVRTAGSTEWSGNRMRFATKDAAEKWVHDLFMRWTAVEGTRVVESKDPVTEP